MMFIFFKKPKFPAFLFVAASLATFILLPLLFLLLKSALTIGATDKEEEEYSPPYYDSENETGDPLITRAPGFKEKIAAPIISVADPALGPANAPVVMVGFFDFTCSFCKKQEQTLRQIMAAYQNKVRLIRKDYPENDIFSPSYQAAMAARCAGEQGKFWEYHNLLFQDNNLNKEKFIELAGEANLNISNFRRCLNNGETKKLVQNNINEANDLGINGVPFTYINGKGFMGEMTYEELGDIIERELK